MEGSSQPEPAQDIHKPFTKAERMQQLSEIDYVGGHSAFLLLP